jgi:ABC-2 type transport system permease protein
MRSTVCRHLALWGDVTAQAVRRDLQFRSQTYLTLVTTVAELMLGMIPVLVLSQAADRTAGGWGSAEGLVAVGVFGATTGLMDCFVSPNLRRFDLNIRRGDLDLILLRPVSAPLFTFLRWVQPAELGRVVTGVIVATIGLRLGGHGIGLSEMATAGTLALAGLVAFSLVWVNLVMLAFWVDSVEPVNDVAVVAREAGQYPLAYFPGPARLLLVTAAPVGLLASVPAAAMLGQRTGLLLAALTVAALTVLTSLHWRAAIRQYNSASS